MDDYDLTIILPVNPLVLKPKQGRPAKQMRQIVNEIAPTIQEDGAQVIRNWVMYLVPINLKF